VPIRRHHNGPNVGCVTFERVEFAPRIQIPHLQRMSQEAETARPSGVTATDCYRFGMAFQSADLAPRIKIPQLERKVRGRRDRAPPVRVTPPL